ncbi:MAG: hypothetical protein M1161_05400 [Candidatus Thermoplasmatota archaeon]|jgi:hypothetical protein|nr:hypothetical protein [Candidatus Thermoplasmatota archaeon]
MKYYAVILVAIVVVVAASGFYIFYENQADHKTQTGNHIYLGAFYGGTTKHVNYVSAKVSFQSGANLRGNVYYVILSIWDSNQSYDQLGIASLYGSFYSTYSYTTLVNGSIQYHYIKRGWFPITPGDYLLSMSASKGAVTFTFDNTSFTADTGGNYFSMAPNEAIGNHSYAGLTVYEEIYNFTNEFPSIAYNFSDIQYRASNSTGYITNWYLFSHNVSNYTSYVYMKSDTVNIYNSPPLTLKINVQNLSSGANLIISDLNITIPGNGQYSINLMKGNYTMYLVNSNLEKSYKIDLRIDNTLVSVTA